MAPSGKILHPFCRFAGVANNGYSLGLQRAIVDFVAESPYAKVPDRIREHYRIELPAGAPARVARPHLGALDDAMTQPAPGADPGAQLVAEVDGGMGSRDRPSRGH